MIRSGNYPDGINDVDFCVKKASSKGGGGNGFAGGGNGGLAINKAGSGAFSLVFGSALTSITLDDFFVRYQSIDGPGFTGGSASGTGRVPSAVPEPTTWAMMIGGLALVGASLRYRRRATARPVTA